MIKLLELTVQFVSSQLLASTVYYVINSYLDSLFTSYLLFTQLLQLDLSLTERVVRKKQLLCRKLTQMGIQII